MCQKIKYLFFSFWVLISSSLLFAQDKNHDEFVKSICGTYSGNYITKKGVPKNGAEMVLMYQDHHTIQVIESDFGAFKIYLDDISPDTLYPRSSMEGMRIKYTKSSKRIFINAPIQGITTTYIGKFRYRDSGDLERQKAAYDSIMRHKSKEVKTYGTYYGTIFNSKTNKRQSDTIKVFDFKIDQTEGNFQVKYKMARIIFSGADSQPYEIRVEYNPNNKTIRQSGKSSIKLFIDLENKVIRFEDKVKKIKFEGIRIEH